MNIFFQLPLDVVKIIGDDLSGIHTNIEGVRLPEKDKKTIRAVKNLLIQRLKVLADKINEEENNYKIQPYILMDFRHHPVKIKFKNYSKKLEEKMSDCISDNDFLYLVNHGELR